jgi:hypothetical protein
MTIATRALLCSQTATARADQGHWRRSFKVDIDRLDHGYWYGSEI